MMLSACAAPIPVTGGTSGRQDARMPDDYLALLDDLRSTGADVVESGQINQALFDVAAEAVKVNGDNVQIFIFQSEAARKAAQDMITENAQSQGPSYNNRPYFWSRGRMLALYAGKNPKVLASMNAALGKPVIEPDATEIPAGLSDRQSG